MTKILVDKAVLEQALEALKYERDANNPLDWHHDKTMTALCAALEQPQVEQEPVAWIERWYGSGPERGWWIVCGRDHIAHLGPAEMSGEAASKIVSAHNTSPPAQRQPLTDEQILDVAESIGIQFSIERLDAQIDDILVFARAIERAHGIGGEK